MPWHTRLLTVAVCAVLWTLVGAEAPPHTGREVSTFLELRSVLLDQRIVRIVLLKTVRMPEFETWGGEVEITRNLTITAVDKPGCEGDIMLLLPHYTQVDPDKVMIRWTAPGSSLQVAFENIVLGMEMHINQYRSDSGMEMSASISGAGIGPQTQLVFKTKNVRIRSNCASFSAAPFATFLTFLGSEPVHPSKAIVVQMNARQNVLVDNWRVSFADGPGQRGFAAGQRTAFQMHTTEITCDAKYFDLVSGFHDTCWHQTRNLRSPQTYRGSVNVTTSGRACLEWRSLDPARAYTPASYPLDHLEGNYCRQIGSGGGGKYYVEDEDDGMRHDASAPWCYVDTNEGSPCSLTDPLMCGWEACSVPICQTTCDCVNAPPGACVTLPDGSALGSADPSNRADETLPRPTDNAVKSNTTGGSEEQERGYQPSFTTTSLVLIPLLTVTVMGGIVNFMWYFIFRASGGRGTAFADSGGVSSHPFGAARESANKSELRSGFALPDTSGPPEGSYCSGSDRLFTSPPGDLEFSSILVDGNGGSESDPTPPRMPCSPSAVVAPGFDPSSTFIGVETTGSEMEVHRIAATWDMFEARRIVDFHMEMQDGAGPGALNLISVIGAGGFGKVYKGQWNGVVVAVKLVEVVTSPGKGSKVQQEVALSKSLRHPNIIATYVASFRQEDAMVHFINGEQAMLHWRTMLVQEYGEGDLKSAREAGRLQAPSGAPLMPRILNLLQDVANGMVYIHQKGIVHADLKPSNVFYTWQMVHRNAHLSAAEEASRPQGNISSSCGKGSSAGVRGEDGWLAAQESREDAGASAVGRGSRMDGSGAVHLEVQGGSQEEERTMVDMVAKIGDFGLSRVLRRQAQHSEEDADAAAASQPQKRKGCRGTLTHLPPEVIISGQATCAMDVFAFGCILWELYMQKDLYVDPQGNRMMATAVVKKVLSAQRHRFNESCPSAYKELANRCWHQDPACRPSFVEIVSAIDRMRDELSSF